MLIQFLLPSFEFLLHLIPDRFYIHVLIRSFFEQLFLQIYKFLRKVEILHLDGVRGNSFMDNFFNVGRHSLEYIHSY